MSRRPLFQQQAFQPQAMRPGVLSGISPAFAGLFQTGRQVVYVLLTRAPLYSHPEGCFRVRLACVKHAASVRSEPGSNSWFDSAVLIYIPRAAILPANGRPAARPLRSPQTPAPAHRDMSPCPCCRHRRSSLTVHPCTSGRLPILLSKIPRAPATPHCAATGSTPAHPQPHSMRPGPAPTRPRHRPH